MTELGPRSPIQASLLLALAWLATACGSGDSGDPPGASGGELTLSVASAATSSPEVWLIVMDDRADATDLQDGVGTELEQYDMKTAAADPCAARLRSRVVRRGRPLARGRASFGKRRRALRLAGDAPRAALGRG